MSGPSRPVARGPGPPSFRILLVVLALSYYLALVKRIPDGRWTRPIGFFTQATCLFPGAAENKIGYRLAAWSCTDRAWQPADVRVYFPMHAENKESRFHRLAHFYKRNRTVLRALDEFITERHDHVDDGVDGPIGGIMLVQTRDPIPPPGSEVERFEFEPFAPISGDGIQELYYTPKSARRARCEAQR
jgi:hypothetical protein